MQAVKDERGYLIWAVGDEHKECARACARSIRYHTRNAKIALLSNNLSNVDFRLFDYVEAFPFPKSEENVFANDWQVFFASPFRETIKIEADMIIPHSIDHWWNMLGKKDVVLTLGARNYRNEPATSRYYRKILDENNLPDVYNAITYWRRSQLAVDFGQLVKDIFSNWETVRKQIKLGMSDNGTTDIVYALAAKILGVENVTLPKTSYPTLIHMKGRINELYGEDWTKECVWELSGPNIRINTIDQQYPFHYYIKEYAQVLNGYYDKYDIELRERK